MTPRGEPERPSTFRLDQVADLAERLTTLLADPAIYLTSNERREWERVLATAKRLADRFDVPK